tara:strand:- start:32 stop:184 length:153 start_codon:yes stop_codon:yes gene_type:complete
MGRDPVDLWNDEYESLFDDGPSEKEKANHAQNEADIQADEEWLENKEENH